MKHYKKEQEREDEVKERDRERVVRVLLWFSSSSFRLSERFRKCAKLRSSEAACWSAGKIHLITEYDRNTKAKKYIYLICIYI